MTELTVQAKKLLLDGGYTCVFTNGENTVTSFLRGVAPLIKLIDGNTSLVGYSAADKVVGAGAAYLYVLLDVKGIWANTISEAARAVLDRYGIKYSFDICVPHIVNRTGDGVCPMEKAVARAQNPKEALECIRKALAELK